MKAQKTILPKHGEKGEYRVFNGTWDENLHYSGDREGCDIYCGNCNTWNTVEGTSILFSITGSCKNCGEPIESKGGKK